MNPNYNMEQQRDEWARMCKQAWVERDAYRSDFEATTEQLEQVKTAMDESGECEVDWCGNDQIKCLYCQVKAILKVKS
jgi:hypothetical protein